MPKLSPRDAVKVYQVSRENQRETPTMNVSDIDDIAGRFDISNDEAERIASTVKSEAEFISTWESTDWWTDANAEGEA